MRTERSLDDGVHHGRRELGEVIGPADDFGRHDAIDRDNHALGGLRKHYVEERPPEELHIAVLIRLLCMNEAYVRADGRHREQLALARRSWQRPVVLRVYSWQ